MSIDHLLTQAGTVQRTGVTGKDKRNNDVVGLLSSYATPCYLEQTEATEVLVDRETYVSNHRLFLPAGSELGPGDRFEQGERVFEVVGEPSRLWNPRTSSENHVEARLREVTG